MTGRKLWKDVDRPKIEEFDRKVLDDVARVGWSDISVFPTKEDPGLPFNYTVGLAEYHHPELIVLGMGSKQMHGVLGAAVAQVKAGKRLSADSYNDQVLVDYRVAFVKVTNVVNTEFPLTMAVHLYGEIRALQIIWPDQNGRFPWDPKMNREMKARQPLLGTWRDPVAPPETPDLPSTDLP